MEPYHNDQGAMGLPAGSMSNELDTPRLRELEEGVFNARNEPDSKYWDAMSALSGYRMALKDLAPLIEAAEKWQANGHMKGCYHADYVEGEPAWCHETCKAFRDALAGLKGQA